MRVLSSLFSLLVLIPSIAGGDDKGATLRPTTHPNLFRWADTCNTYVLRKGDAALLFNTGDGSVAKKLPSIGVSKVEWILLTDHHRENCQDLSEFAQGGVQVACSQTEREILEAPTQFRKWNPTLGDKYSVYGASYVRPLQSPISINRTLESGEVFEWQGHRIRCLATPGTSPGGMTYLLEHDGQTFAVTGSVMHNGARMVNWFDTEWDYGFAKGVDTLIESVSSLAKDAPQYLLPSQGPIVENATEQLGAYKDKLTAFRANYVRGYPVLKDEGFRRRDPISQPTAVPHINRVTPHLYKLSDTTKGRNFAIIVADSGHALVLDCGLFPKEMLEEIVVGMRAHLGLKQIDAFWISHMHGDHFLLGPTLKEKYGAEAWTLDSIVDRCENPHRYDYAALVNTYGDGFDGMKIEKPFRDGETVEWEGYTIHVDWMPGQTEFGCCLWLDIDGKRIAFTGDNLFGTSSDETQNGHEAVVARNSSILEEGYILGSKYLLDLKPDIVMGSHSYVMPEPREFLERYHAWSKLMAQQFRELLPDENYEYLYDPYWVSAYPYRVDLSAADTADVTVTIRNFRSEPQTHHVKLCLPPGLTAEPAILEGDIPAKSEHEYQVKLRVDRKNALPGVQIVPFDITLDGKRWGQMFDFVTRATAD